MTTQLRRKLEAMTPEQRERLQAAMRPRIVEPYIAHIPHPKQQVFLSLKCREAMYGGAAGGGKSDAILMSALQYVDVPGYSALILRRTWPDLNAAGAILDRARTWFAPTDAHQKDGGRIIEFPSGARLSFGYLQHDKDKYKFQSAEYQFIGFDELTHFEESQYTYMNSRLRRPSLICLNCKLTVRLYTDRRGVKRYKHTNSANPCKDIFPDPKVMEQYKPSLRDDMTVFDIPLRMRSATNPGGIGNDWVKRHFVDAETRAEGSIFVPALLKDNPSLDREAYRESLSHLSIVDRQRLEQGDWDVVEPGDYFQRQWFKPISQRTEDNRVRLCRFWDLAATSGGGDWTAGCLLALYPDGHWEILDIIRGQWSSAKIEGVMTQVAMQDGPHVPIRMEQEPGSSGKNLIDVFRRGIFTGYNFDGIRPTGSKSDRAYAVKVAAEKGLVSILVNQFTTAFLNEAEAFPGGMNDDMIDAVSGAWGYLAFGRRARLIA